MRPSIETQDEARVTSPIVLRLQLFVAGETARARRNAHQLREVLDELLPKDAYVLDVIDVLEHAEVAEAMNIIATPTLIRRDPPSDRRIIGDLADRDRLRSLLGDLTPPDTQAGDQPTG